MPRTSKGTLGGREEVDCRRSEVSAVLAPSTRLRLDSATGSPAVALTVRKRISTEVGGGGVRFGRLVGGFCVGGRLGSDVSLRRGRLLARRHEDEVRGGVVAQQAPRTKLDMGEAGRIEPASASFAEVDDGLRSEASLAWGGEQPIPSGTPGHCR